MWQQVASYILFSLREKDERADAGRASRTCLAKSIPEARTGIPAGSAHHEFIMPVSAQSHDHAPTNNSEGLGLL